MSMLLFKVFEDNRAWAASCSVLDGGAFDFRGAGMEKQFRSPRGMKVGVEIKYELR
jgi:hypothetical protein